MPPTEKKSCSRRAAGKVVDSGKFHFRPVTDKIVRETFNPEGGSAPIAVELAPAKGNVCPRGAETCQTQLVTRKDQRGFAIRLCTGAKTGTEVPVKTAQEAQSLAQRFCACRAKEPDAQKCVRRSAGWNVGSGPQGAPGSALEAYRRGRKLQVRLTPRKPAKAAPKRRLR